MGKEGFPLESGGRKRKGLVGYTSLSSTHEYGFALRSFPEILKDAYAKKHIRAHCGRGGFFLQGEQNTRPIVPTKTKNSPNLALAERVFLFGFHYQKGCSPTLSGSPGPEPALKPKRF